MVKKTVPCIQNAHDCKVAFFVELTVIFNKKIPLSTPVLPLIQNNWQFIPFSKLNVFSMYTEYTEILLESIWTLKRHLVSWKVVFFVWKRYLFRVHTFYSIRIRPLRLFSLAYSAGCVSRLKWHMPAGLHRLYPRGSSQCSLAVGLKWYLPGGL